jgi:hypothetical protein
MVHGVEIASQLRRSHKYALAMQYLVETNCPFKTLLLEQDPRLSACLLSTLYLFDQLRAGMHQDTDRKDPLTFLLKFVSETPEMKLHSWVIPFQYLHLLVIYGRR